MDPSYYVASPVFDKALTLMSWNCARYLTIFAKEVKDIPEWMKAHHVWQAAMDVKKLPEMELKMKICCLKCEEKVIEELRDVPGVFDVKTERVNKKVTVVGSTKEGPDRAEILRRARKIHRKARITHTTKFIAKDEGGDKKGKPNTTTVYVTNPLLSASGYGASTHNSGEYRPSQSYPARQFYPTYPAPSSGPYAYYSSSGPY